MPWTFCRVLYLNPAYHLKKRRQLVGRDTFLLYQITDKPLFYLGKQSHCFNVSRVYKNDVHRAELALGGHAIFPPISE